MATAAPPGYSEVTEDTTDDLSDSYDIPCSWPPLITYSSWFNHLYAE